MKKTKLKIFIIQKHLLLTNNHIVSYFTPSLIWNGNGLIFSVSSTVSDVFKNYWNTCTHKFPGGLKLLQMMPGNIFEVIYRQWFWDWLHQGPLYHTLQWYTDCLLILKLCSNMFFFLFMCIKRLLHGVMNGIRLIK